MRLRSGYILRLMSVGRKSMPVIKIDKDTLVVFAKKKSRVFSNTRQGFDYGLKLKKSKFYRIKTDKSKIQLKKI